MKRTSFFLSLLLLCFLSPLVWANAGGKAGSCGKFFRDGLQNTDTRLSPAFAQQASTNSKDLNPKNSVAKETSRPRRAVQREFGFWDSIQWMIQKNFVSREPEKDSPKLSSS